MGDCKISRVHTRFVISDFRDTANNTATAVTMSPSKIVTL
jgi:hypothetical protein